MGELQNELFSGRGIASLDKDIYRSCLVLPCSIRLLTQ